MTLVCVQHSVSSATTNGVGCASQYPSDQRSFATALHAMNGNWQEGKGRDCAEQSHSHSIWPLPDRVRQDHHKRNQPSDENQNEHTRSVHV